MYIKRMKDFKSLVKRANGLQEDIDKLEQQLVISEDRYNNLKK